MVSCTFQGDAELQHAAATGAVREKGLPALGASRLFLFLCCLPAADLLVPGAALRAPTPRRRARRGLSESDKPEASSMLPRELMLGHAAAFSLEMLGGPLRERSPCNSQPSCASSWIGSRLLACWSRAWRPLLRQGCCSSTRPRGPRPTAVPGTRRGAAAAAAMAAAMAAAAAAAAAGVVAVGQALLVLVHNTCCWFRWPVPRPQPRAPRAWQRRPSCPTERSSVERR